MRNKLEYLLKKVGFLFALMLFAGLFNFIVFRLSGNAVINIYLTTGLGILFFITFLINKKHKKWVW